MVTCGRWGEDQLLDALDGRLAERVRAELEAHLAECPACRCSVEELRPIAALRQAPPLAPGVEADRAVREALARASRPPTRRHGFRRLVGRTRGPAAFWVAAASLFTVVILAAVLSTSRSPKGVASAPRRTGSTPETPPPVESPPAPRSAPPRSPETPAPSPAPPLPERREEPPTRPAPPDRPAPPRDPEPAPAKPPAPTVVAAAEVEFGRVMSLSGRAERAGRPLAKGERLLAGDGLTCVTGVLLVETSDRSLVALRAGSSLTLGRSGEDVALRLGEGEIACSVTKRPARRFAVDTAHGSAAVLGTVFGVRSGSASATVTVARGKVAVRTERGALEVEAGQRTTISRASAPARAEPLNADRALAWAFDAGLRVIGPVWVVVGGPGSEFQAPMTRGRLFATGSLGGEPVFAAVDSRTLPTWNGRFLAPEQRDGGWVTVTVELPEAGTWHLWGRFFFPASGTQLFRQDAEPRENDPNSFFASVDGGREHVFGNHKVDPETRTSGYRRWHWGGDGTIEVGKPAALSLGTLARGRHTIRIRNRDAVETAALRLAPRIDVLCLSPDRDYRPRDEDFRK